MKLRDHILTHDNAYRGLLMPIVSKLLGKPPNLSIIIPFYKADNTIRETVTCLIAAADYARTYGGIGTAALRIVVDGCAPPDLFGISCPPGISVSLDHHPFNLGRGAARNTGLFRAEGDLTFFVDADIWIDPHALFHHVCLHRQFDQTLTPAITFGLFRTFKIRGKDTRHLKRADLTPSNGIVDFRTLCDFKEAYLCRPEDSVFVGRRFEILADTDALNAWPLEGWHGPWTLPEMCLGGLFCVKTKEAQAVGGLDATFNGYGYEETSLVAKLLVATGCKVVPEQSCENLHIDIEDEGQSRAMKDELLRQSYRKYHAVFLEHEFQRPMTVAE
ncbi:glycosyltransferase [Rhodovulum sulfidophilum]|uniref:Glycosyltransferase family 2 protein n=1 Tax=Rhodovulum sulfidophilum TaxID=35806 RepID=A0ABS1RX19_RHOSU|nr:glycosyltransferase [Rhodovulum sulfidophilum]MBL3610586.1 glycosyltransferase family 2 protein [Rhodovulum sulfidophilum]MCE8456632.1 glycosyltransferase [Rhodovulum sulfidophilum]